MNKKKVSDIFRISTPKLNQNKMKILFAIGCVSKEKIVLQKDLSKALNIPLSSIGYHITNLRSEELINKNNKLTKKGRQAIQYFKHWDKTFTKSLRAHKIQISLSITSLPSNFFTLRHKTLSPFTNKRYQGLKGEIEGTQILFYSSKKAMLILPEVYGNNDQEILGAINSITQNLYDAIKLEFPGIKLGDYEICKFTSMHCAIVNSVIAESFLLQKGSCYSSDEICIDNSHGKPELECENLDNVFDNLGIMMNYEQLAQENKQIKALLHELTTTFKNNNKQESLDIARKLLAKTKENDNNLQSKMPKLPERIHIPEGYGSYFL